jgi:hypothetical protein
MLLLGLGGYGLYQMGFANGYNRAVLAIQEGGAALISPFSGAGVVLLIIGLVYLVGFVLVLPWRTHRHMRSRWQNLSPEQREALHKKWQAGGCWDWRHMPNMEPPLDDAPEPEVA